MIIVTGDRGSGKTLALIKWLLQGHRHDDGNWSRTIVTQPHRVQNLTAEISRQIDEKIKDDPSWTSPMDRDGHLVRGCNDLGSLHGALGCREVAVDDVGYMVAKMLSEASGRPTAPAIVAINSSQIVTPRGGSRA